MKKYLTNSGLEILILEAAVFVWKSFNWVSDSLFPLQQHITARYADLEVFEDNIENSIY